MRSVIGLNIDVVNGYLMQSQKLAV